MWRRITLLGLLVAGCAQAGEGGIGPIPDAAPPIDTVPADAAPVTVTLKQTTSSTLGAANGFVCTNTTGGTTADNAWYRVFRLADANVTGELTVSSIGLGVQSAAGMPVVTIKLGTYAGTLTPPPDILDEAMITPLAMTTYVAQNVPNGAPLLVQVPLQTIVPAGAQLVVEISVPDYSMMAKAFVLAGNAAGQTAPAWLRSAACMSPTPKSIPTFDSPQASLAHLVIEVTGTYAP